MIKLIVSRYFIEEACDHETFEDAAVDAVFQLEWGESYPVKIIDGGKVLWEQDGPCGNALKYLEKVAANKEKNQK